MARLLPLLLLFLLMGTAGVITKLVVSGGVHPESESISPLVLGETTLTRQAHFDTLTIPTATPTPYVLSPLPVVTARPDKEASTIILIDGPGELVEGDVATFTWHVGGPSAVIHTTTVYYGTTSAHGSLDDYVTPADAHYTYRLKDFLQGTYAVPLRFVGSVNQLAPGTYFYRAYAAVDGKHIWSDERSFAVKQAPKHEIKIASYPTTVSPGGNAAFTWDVYGPEAETGFTAIVGGRQSKPGILDDSTDIPKTPYSVLVNDFARGVYTLPKRFVGNASFADPGVYYFRALVFINGKNIWSDEYSFTVQ